MTNWPNKSKFSVFLSHDIDHVQKQWFQALYYFFKQKRIYHLSTLFSLNNRYWLFDTITDLEKKYNVKSTFFFLNESLEFKLSKLWTWKKALGRYNFSNKRVCQMMRHLDKQGWEIGLHGSYNSFLRPELLPIEKKQLEEVLGHPVYGIRQHCLNLTIPETWKKQKATGFRYDASFGFNKKIGFRDNKYLPFYPINGSFLVIPLSLMDGNLFDSTLMSKAEDEKKIWQKCLKIIDKAEKEGAVLSVLWHGRFFDEKEFPGCVRIYEKIIVECQKRNAWFAKGEEICNYYNKNVKNSSH